MTNRVPIRKAGLPAIFVASLSIIRQSNAICENLHDGFRLATNTAASALTKDAMTCACTQVIYGQCIAVSNNTGVLPYSYKSYMYFGKASFPPAFGGWRVGCGECLVMKSNEVL